MLTRLDHVQIAVRDLEEATRSYTGLLGVHPAWRGESPEQGASSAVFRLGNASIELICPSGEGPLGHLARRHLADEDEGPLALGFETDDAEDCAKGLCENDVAAAAPVRGEDREVATGAERRWRVVPVAPGATRGIRIFAVEYLANPVPRSVPLESAAGAHCTGMDHVVIQSRDPDATLDVWGRGLGIRLALDRSFEARGVRLLFFRLAGVTLEVAARLDDAPEPHSADRLFGIAYQVADVGAARERLAAEASFDVSEVRRGHKPGTSVCTLRAGTHGVATLLIGPES